jgi:zinc transporter ZupT
VALLAHKLPEGAAIAALARGTGASPGRALAITAAIQACTVVGYAGGAVAPWSAPALGTALGLVAGSFLFVAGGALATAAVSRAPRRELGAAAVGASLIVLARLAGG